MRYLLHAGEGLQRHVDRCGFCNFLEEHGHGVICWECNHPWHKGPCGFDLGDVPDERFKGGAIALGPCQCTESEIMTPEQVWEEQNRHAREEDEAAYDRAMDRKIDEALGK